MQTHIPRRVFIYVDTQNVSYNDSTSRFVIEPQRKLFKGVEAPGEIRYFSSGEVTEVVKFEPGEKFEKDEMDDCPVEIGAVRGTGLGTNVYSRKKDIISPSHGTHGFVAGDSFQFR